MTGLTEADVRRIVREEIAAERERVGREISKQLPKLISQALGRRAPSPEDDARPNSVPGYYVRRPPRG